MRTLSAASHICPTVNPCSPGGSVMVQEVAITSSICLLRVDQIQAREEDSTHLPWKGKTHTPTFWRRKFLESYKVKVQLHHKQSISLCFYLYRNKYYSFKVIEMVMIIILIACPQKKIRNRKNHLKYG